MFMNVLALLSSLFSFFAFLYSSVPHKELHKIYEKNILMTRKNFDKFSLFCQSDKQIWAYTCELVLNELRKETEYEEAYLDYQSFAKLKDHMCQEEKVQIVREYLEFEEDYLKSSKTPIIPQIMATCFLRSAVVQNNIDLEKEKFHKKVGIYPLNLANVMVFQQGNEDIYDPFKWLEFQKQPKQFQLLLQPTPSLITDVLFIQNPPVSNNIKAEVLSIIKNEMNIIKKLDRKNIVHQTTTEPFAKLCKMTLRRSNYPNFYLNLQNLENGKPKKMTVTVSIAVNYETYTIKMDGYECLKQKNETETNANTNRYVLVQGPNRNSVIVLERSENISDNFEFTPVEIIDNVFAEFIQKIYLPTDKKV